MTQSDKKNHGAAPGQPPQKAHTDVPEVKPLRDPPNWPCKKEGQKCGKGRDDNPPKNAN